MLSIPYEIPSDWAGAPSVNKFVYYGLISDATHSIVLIFLFALLAVDETGSFFPSWCACYTGKTWLCFVGVKGVLGVSIPEGF